MSGIAGIIHFDGAPVEPGLIEKMTTSMAHRGPDGIHHWVKGNVALGQCMLCTTPESLEERQPLTNEDESLVLVMDGRVDNWEELRQELLGRCGRLRDRSDAELVLRSYETWGEQCLAHIDGDFALAIWNARTREAFCARDRTGRKPFYYAPSATCLAFASEFGTLLQLGFVSRDFNNDDIIGTLLTGGQSFTQTLVKGIVRLPPACLMTARGGAAQPRRYWDIDCFAELRYPSEGDYQEHFRQVIGDAVRRRLRSASPVGVYVSGGLDSSAVLFMASAQTPDRRGLCSLSATFPGLACDESSHIAAANSKAGVTGYLFPFLPPRGEFYVEQVWRFSDVCDSPNAAPLNALRAFTQQTGIRVALTGHGADELLGRNPYYYRDLLREHGYRALAAQVVLDACQSGALLPVLRGAIGAGIRRYGPGSLVHVWSRRRSARNRSARLDAQLIPPSHSQRESIIARLRASGRCKKTEVPTHAYRHALCPVAESIRGTEIDNRTASIFGVEERDPFQDRHVLEFAFALPESLRSRGSGKYILRESLRGVLPDSVRLRGDKAEFSDTLAMALLDETVGSALACRRLVDLGYVEKDRVTSSYQRFRELYRSGDLSYIDHVWGLWMAFVLETWVSMMESRPGPVPAAAGAYTQRASAAGVGGRAGARVD